MPNPLNPNSDPRSYIRNYGVDVQYLSVAFDNTIQRPGIQTPGPGPGPVSPQLGAAVTWVGAGTSTYGNDTASNWIVGLGSANQPVAGIVIHVDPDGFGSIAYKGNVAALANKNNPPLIGGLVAVDGTGQVQAASNTAGNCANAKCMSFETEPAFAVYTHPQGTITPPTTNQQSGSVEYCEFLLS